MVSIQCSFFFYVNTVVENAKNINQSGDSDVLCRNSGIFLPFLPLANLSIFLIKVEINAETDKSHIPVLSLSNL